MAVIQFLLGVDAPVSWLLIQQIVLQVLVNCLIALPVYESCAVCSTGRCRVTRGRVAGGPTRPRSSPLQRPSERLGGERPGASAMMLGSIDERTPADDPAARAARGA